MSLRNSLRRNTNPNYRMDHSERSNIQMVTFSKNYKRYEYWFLIHSMEAFLLMPLDRQSHREIPLIFNSDIFETLNEKIKEVNHDFNFMNIFCFGQESFLAHNLDDMIKSTHISGEDLIDYSATINKFAGELSFLMMMKILFNINTGKLATVERFNAYTDTGVWNSSFNPIVADAYWPSFKRKFMTMYGSDKIDKKLNDLTFDDSTIVQMMNI